MKISRTNAEQIAKKICQPLKDKIALAEKELSETATQLAVKKIPKVVMQAFKSHPEYVNTRSSVWFSGVGLRDYDYISLTKQVPALDRKINISASEAKQLLRLKQTLEHNKEHYDAQKVEITNTLIALGSYKRIAENLPDVAPYLPTKDTVALIVPIDNVKNNIKKLLNTNEPTKAATA